MKHLSLCTIVFSMLLLANLSSAQQIDDERFVSYIVDLNKQTLKFYLKNDNGHNFGNHYELKNELKSKNKELIFATNGGMYLKDGSPQGLYIENGTVKKPVNTIKSGYGNFYLQPNGVFYITNENKAIVCETSQYTYSPQITYATQSGPMLVIDGKIHAVFKKNSEHFHIRNGVGVLPNGKLLFAMSKDTITLYDFADFFKSQGCENALYLDGFISRTYLPKKKWEQLDGHFGVIIAEIKE